MGGGLGGTSDEAKLELSLMGGSGVIHRVHVSIEGGVSRVRHEYIRLPQCPQHASPKAITLVSVIRRSQIFARIDSLEAFCETWGAFGGRTSRLHASQKERDGGDVMCQRSTQRGQH
jgi:hypothetical protein